MRVYPNDNIRSTPPLLSQTPQKGYLLDCSLSVAEGLKTHLKLYKLRSKVKIKDATALYDVLVSGVQDPWQAAESGEGRDMSAAPAEAAGETDAGAGGRVARFADPRSPALGVRVIRPKGEAGERALLSGGVVSTMAVGSGVLLLLLFLVFLFSRNDARRQCSARGGPGSSAASPKRLIL